MAATSMRAHAHTPLQVINRGNHFMRPLRSSFTGKQKSAVELLQESKCLYVKSETVLDHRQQLKSSSPDHLHSPYIKVGAPPVPPKSAQVRRAYNSAASATDQPLAKSAPLRRSYNSSALATDQPQTKNAQFRRSYHSSASATDQLQTKSAQLRRSYNSSASATDQLQAKLRKLLNADSKENLVEDLNVNDEFKKSPQHNQRSNSQKHSKRKTIHGCPVHHKSLPDLHAGVDTSSDSSEPASCEYHLYTSNRKSSSQRQSTNDDTSVDSSTSQSKPVSRQASTSSHSTGSVGRRGLAPPSPVKSCVSYGGCTSNTEYRGTDAMSDSEDVSRLRPILRSKSDVGHRCTKLSPAPPSPPTSADLDAFFEHLGLNLSDFQFMTKPSSQTSSPVFFSDTSSVDSTTLCATNQSAGGSSEGASSSAGELPSIVERNARIIKWLCNCRKAAHSPAVS